MRKGISALVFLIAASLCAFGQTAKTVASIDKLHTEIAAKAAACEKDDEQGEIGPLVMNTLAVNSRGHQWRAVGQYRPTYRFFYRSVEDDENRLYPDQLVFVVRDHLVSDRKNYEEYLFNDAGRLVFHKQRFIHDEKGPIERLVYFSDLGKAIRITENGKPREKFSELDRSVVADIVKTAEKLTDLFRLSINI